MSFKLEMSQIDSLDKRIYTSWNILKANFIKYFLYDVVMVLVGILFFIVLMFIAGIFIFTFSFSNNILLKFTSYLIGLLLFILAFWILISLIKIANFYLTKYFTEDENKVDLGFIVKLSIKKLIGKAWIDLWYSLFMLIPILFFIIAISIWVISHIYIDGNINLIVGILSFLFMVFGFISLIYIIVELYFAFYYCFDENKFDFKTFKRSMKLVENNFLEVLGNIIIITIILSVLAYIFKLIIFGIFGFSIADGLSDIIMNIKNIENLKDFQDITTIYSFSVSIILYVILVKFIKWIFDLYYFIYFFVYYKFLKNKSKVE